MSDLTLSAKANSPCLSEYTIVIANPEQEEQHQISAYETWGKGMTYNEFRAIATREQAEGGWAENQGDITWSVNHDHKALSFIGSPKLIALSTGEGLTCFKPSDRVLVKRDDSKGKVYSSCETQRMQAFLKLPGQDHIQDTWVYGVTVINTPQRYQGNGYATHLCRLLHHVLNPTLPFPREHGARPCISFTQRDSNPNIPPAVASILWSDVGTKIYEKCHFGPSSESGWKFDSRDSTMLTWNLRSDFSSSPSSSSSSSADGLPDQTTDGNQWEWLYPHDVSWIAPLFAETLKKRMINESSLSARPIFAINPLSEGTLTFLATRGRYGPQPSWRKEGIEPIGLIHRGISSSSPSHTSTVDVDLNVTDPQPSMFQPETEFEPTFVLLTISPQITDRLLITCVQNVRSHHVPSLLSALNIVASSHLGHPKEAIAWGLDCEDEFVATLIAMEDRNTSYRSRDEKNEGSLLGIAWYGWPDQNLAQDPEIQLAEEENPVNAHGGKMVDTQMWNWC